MRNGKKVTRGVLPSLLVLVAMLSSLALLADRWRQAYGGSLTNLAVAASLLAKETSLLPRPM